MLGLENYRSRNRRWSRELRPARGGHRKPASTYSPACRLSVIATFRRPDAQLDNRITAFFAWLFQNLFLTRAHWTNCTAIEKKKTSLRGFRESPLPDSNRRPPPYHAIRAAVGCIQWQRFGARSGRFAAFREPNVCHWLRPLCSVAVPSQSAQRRAV